MALEAHNVSVSVRSAGGKETPNLDALRDTVLDLVLANEDLTGLMEALADRLKPSEMAGMMTFMCSTIAPSHAMLVAETLAHCREMLEE